MKRAAIIVGSPGHPVEAPPLLTGIRADVVSFKQFLLSDNGGAWTESEIHTCWHPAHKDLVEFLRSLNVEYSITVFCGHGWRENGHAAILVRPSEGMWVSDFRTSAPRQLTIIDACQVDEEPTGLVKEAERRVASGLLGAPFNVYRLSCRTLYDKAIAAVGEQRTIMWGCKIGQTSGENPEGGYFSQALLQESDAWSRGARQGANVATDLLDVRGAFGAAEQVVLREHFPQAPQLESGRGRSAFPFAVA